MYAILNISGKQFKASVGNKVKVPKQSGEIGTNLILDQVMLFNDGSKSQFGTPIISGVSVTAKIVNHGRDKKILVYKKKRRKGYQRKNGHRQCYSKIKVDTITLSKPKKTISKPKKSNAQKKEKLNK